MTKFAIPIFFLLSFLMVSTKTEAQVEKTIHQTYNVEGAQTITIQIKSGEYEIENWAGNTILIETNIKLEQATTQILNYVVEQGRYQVILDQNEGAFTLKDKEPIRNRLRSKTGDCVENITMKILVPDEFTIVGLSQLLRKQ
jgi:hypothetical protein